MVVVGGGAGVGVGFGGVGFGGLGLFCGGLFFGPGAGFWPAPGANSDGSWVLLPPVSVGAVVVERLEPETL